MYQYANNDGGSATLNAEFTDIAGNWVHIVGNFFDNGSMELFQNTFMDYVSASTMRLNPFETDIYSQSQC